jgi:division protein CdvB (Snf7/Vps24/ESCRT-III family)
VLREYWPQQHPRVETAAPLIMELYRSRLETAVAALAKVASGAHDGKAWDEVDYEIENILDHFNATLEKF